VVRTPQSASGSLGSHPPELQTLLYALDHWHTAKGQGNSALQLYYGAG
jgi:hypothetical protein